MAAPARLAHFVLRTNDIDALSNWYCTVLEAKVVHRNKMIALRLKSRLGLRTWHQFPGKNLSGFVAQIQASCR